MDIEIRRATPEDAAVIVDIGNACWRWAYAHIMPAEDLAGLEQPGRNERIARTLRPTFLAQSNGRVLGFASIEEPCALPQADFEIGGLYVRPEAARKGIGRQLVAQVARDGLQRGRRNCAIHTLRDNLVGRAFYDKIGGEVVAEAEWGFRDRLYPTVWYLYSDLDALARLAPEALASE